MNKWTDGDKVVSSPNRPRGQWWPVVSTRRVRGASYTPYERGSAEWRKAANAALASHARANFETGKR